MNNRMGRIGKKISEKKIDYCEAERILEALRIGERFHIRRIQK